MIFSVRIRTQKWNLAHPAIGWRWSRRCSYGTVLTEILNLDVTPFQKLLDRLNTAVHEKNYDDAPRAYMDMQKGMETLRDDALMEYDRAKRHVSALWNNHR